MFVPIYSLFFILLSGYFAKRLKVIPQSQSIIFIDFVITFALPAMIFDTIYHIEINAQIILVVALGFASTLIGAIFALYLGYIFKFGKITIVCISFLSMFGNTIFVGLPIVQGFLGSSATNKIILYDQFATGIPLAITAPFILSFAGANSQKITQSLKQVIKFPPFIALVFAFVFKGTQIPEFIFVPFKMLGASVTPVALFAVGLGLSFNGIKTAWKSTFIVLFGKMIIPPIIFIAIIKIFDITITQDWVVGALLCSMPPMVSAAAMVMKAGLDSNLAVTSVTLGIVFATITSPLIYLILT